MHICFLTSEYPKEGYPHGGIGTFVKTIAKALVDNGHKVSVVGVNYINAYEVEDDNGVLVYRLRASKVKGLKWWFNNRQFSKQIEAIHKKHPIDIVEVSELGLAFLQKLPSISYIIRLHGGHHFFAESEQRKIHWWSGLQEKRSFKKADGFIAVSNYVKEHTNTYLSYNNKPIEVISSPVNLDVFNPEKYKAKKSNSILFAGTVCEKKGIRQLVLSMKKVLKTYPFLQLDIYGRDWYYKNGRSYIEELKTIIRGELPELENKIIFHGSVPINELASHYKSSRLCVFPSLMETQGLVAQEAMAMGKLVVFSELGPGKECIEHQKTGLLCNPYEVDSISEAINWSLENELASKQIEVEARVFVLEKYNISQLLNRNIKFYKSVK